MAAAGVAGAAATGAAAGADAEEEEEATVRALVTSGISRTIRILAATTFVLVAAVATPAEEPAGQKRFKSPEAAWQALVTAARAGDRAKLLAILGPEGEAIVSSGDDVEDAADRRRFVANAERTTFEKLPDGAVVANIGPHLTPFAIPIVKDGDSWRFDTAAGKDELINRRIGRNELSTIAACRAYVEAQQEYARADRTGNGAGSYAQRLRSEPGKRDGLYWEATSAKDESPLGPLFADATAEGYTPNEASSEPQPFHGYFFRILTAQGPNAPGGAQDYVKDGKMAGGFALVAWPAEYGQSGIMTFLVNRQGIVFQKNLGPQTADLVKAMTAYDPDASWVPTR